jgi:hypothetical protein
VVNVQVSFGQRVLAGLLVGAIAVVFVLAAMIKPEEKGFGSHKQLGLPACGFLVVTGRPCMTCGMTTSFAHAAEGNMLESVRTQPGGAVLVILGGITFLAGLHTLVTGSRMLALWGSVFSLRFGLGLVGVILLAWGYVAWNWPVGGSGG